jgi:hypothetical protein
MGPLFSFLTPTRARPERFTCFVESLGKTATIARSYEVVAAIDDDDSSYDQLLQHSLPSVVWVKGPRSSMGALNTRCLHRAQGQVIILANDDLVMRTIGWDHILHEAIQEISDEIYLIHVRDEMKNERFPCFPILSRACCTALQDPFPSLYPGDGIDLHLHDIFLQLRELGFPRIRYLPHITMEHQHPATGRAHTDSIYQTRSHRAGNQVFYALWRERETAARRLASVIQHPRLLPLSSVSSQKVFGNRSPYESDFQILSRTQNPFLLIWRAVYQSRLPFRYRLRYGIYHFLRELYFCAHLHRVKRLLFQRRVP